MNQSSSNAIKVGDLVWIPLPVGRVWGTVVEDRGPLGVSNQHIFRIQVPNDPSPSDDFVVPAGEITPLSQSERGQLREKISADDVKRFLMDGGLVSILQKNSPEPIWLKRDSRGNLTFTFVEGHSTTGGQPAPAFALHGEKVFTPKKRKVIDFVKSFGLTDASAKEILDSVGVAP